MSIVSHNALLNQYVPTFYLKDLRDGQTIVFDARRKAFVNATGSIGSDSLRLSDLLDVSDSLDNPLLLQPGQALVYNPGTSQWEAGFIDYETIRNKPTSADFSFSGLADVAKPPIPNAYLQWDALGTEIIYSTTIPHENITGLHTVAITGDYRDLSNLPVINDGTVTKFTFNNANGIVGTVVNSTTTPELTLALEDITPNSISATGNISALNLTGVNTGDQTIVLEGDITGSGTGTFTTTLSDTGVLGGVYGSGTSIPVITVDSKGRITHATYVDVQLNSGTVTSVQVVAGPGIEVTGTEITTSGSYTVGLAETGVTPGVYGDSHYIPSVTVNSTGQITNISTQHVDTSARDLVYGAETLVIAARHQYIVTGTLEVDGRIENNGRIAIL